MIMGHLKNKQSRIKVDPDCYKARVLRPKGARGRSQIALRIETQTCEYNAFCKGLSLYIPLNQLKFDILVDGTHMEGTVS